jgi:undecaprenyl-diphosphatase
MGDFQDRRENWELSQPLPWETMKVGWEADRTSRNATYYQLALRSDAILLILALLFVAGLILGFGLLADEVLEGETAGFDRTILAALRGADGISPVGPVWLQEMGRDVTALGSPVFLAFISVAAVGYLLLIRQRSHALLVSISVLGGELQSTALKIAFDRSRPDIPSTVRVFTASFPSGHAMLSAVTFLTLGALLARTQIESRVKAYFISIAVFLTIAVGLSRLYLGVHYPSDVLAGWCVGSAWALFCWSIALWLEQDRRPVPR